MLSSTRIKISYAALENDPGKKPRPHYLYVEDGVVRKVDGGEIGELTGFIGFSKTVEPKINDIPKMVQLSALLEEDFDPKTVVGTYAQFVDARGIFGYSVPVESVLIGEGAL